MENNLSEKDINLTLELITDACPSSDSLTLIESIDTPKGNFTGVVLASLDGPVMDYMNPTRNTRLYEEELCDSIHSSDYVNELLSTKNFLGEPDHPMKYQNRLDIHYPEVSHAIRNFRKVPNKGCYYATFDILDTPNGRILKTLIDYGVKLGVSSRGSGRTISKGGRIVVDKNTYRFITFDIVAMPGNKVARLPITNESVEEVPGTLTEQVNKLLESRDLDGLKSIKPLLNFLGENADLGSLIDRIDEAINSDESNTITESATADLLEAYATIKDLKSQLIAKDSIINELTDGNKRLNESMVELQNTTSELKSNLSKSAEIVKVHLKREQESRRLLESIQLQLNDQVELNHSLQESIDSLNRTTSMNESVVRSLKSNLEKKSDESSKRLMELQE